MGLHEQRGCLDLMQAGGKWNCVSLRTISPFGNHPNELTLLREPEPASGLMRNLWNVSTPALSTCATADRTRPPTTIAQALSFEPWLALRRR